MSADYCEGVLNTQYPYLPNSSSISQQLNCSSYIYEQGIRLPWERGISITVLLIGILIGLIGNTMVIISSFKYGTFKLDRVTIVLVRNLAIADLMLVFMYDMPLLVTHLAREWVLGEHMCYVLGFGFVVPCCANMAFVMLVSSHRYIRCRWPLKAGLINPNHTRIMVVTQWAVCLLVWVGYAAAARVQLEFNRNVVICLYTFADAERIPHFLFMSSTLVGCIVTLFTNVSMWNIVRKCGQKTVVPTASLKRKSDLQTKQSSVMLTEEPSGSLLKQEESSSGRLLRKEGSPESILKKCESSISILKKCESSLSILKKGPERQQSSTSIQAKALITTSVVTSLFLVSWSPTLIRYFLASWPSRLIIPPPGLDKAMAVTFSLGCWLNPIIYTIINQGFRNFVRGKIRGIISTHSLSAN